MQAQASFEVWDIVLFWIFTGFLAGWTISRARLRLAPLAATASLHRQPQTRSAGSGTGPGGRDLGGGARDQSEINPLAMIGPVRTVPLSFGSFETTTHTFADVGTS